MLIEFRVENHRSVRDEQALTLEVGSDPSVTDIRPREVPGYRTALLPVAAIYGANASGKSNVLSGLAYMRDAVIQSQRTWAPEGGVPREPFGWGPKTTEASFYEVSFISNGIRYQYGFLADDERFLEEWLYACPGIMAWRMLDSRQNEPEDSGLQEQFINLLKAADIGITDIKVETTEDEYAAGPRGSGGTTRKRVFFRHDDAFEDAWLPLEDESQGTRTLFRIAPTVLSVVRNGGLLLVDELEASLHPTLARKIVGHFNDPRTNPNNAKMLFTTHDTHLLRRHSSVGCRNLLKY